MGRIVLINFGEDKNKLATIVDVVDHNRVLVDGPTTDVARQVISIKRLTLTKFLVDCPRGARSKTVRKVMETSGVVAKFQASGAGQKIAKAAIRRNLTDFDRHKVMLGKMKVRPRQAPTSSSL